jgi:hypothetical protein
MPTEPPKLETSRVRRSALFRVQMIMLRSIMAKLRLNNVADRADTVLFQNFPNRALPRFSVKKIFFPIVHESGFFENIGKPVDIGMLVKRSHIPSLGNFPAFFVMREIMGYFFDEVFVAGKTNHLFS